MKHTDVQKKDPKSKEAGQKAAETHTHECACKKEDKSKIQSKESSEKNK